MFRNKWLLFLALAALGIKIFSFFPDAVEKSYSTGIYPWMAWIQRLFFGWIPFSMGDLLYAFVFIWLAVQSVSLIRRVVSKKADKAYLLRAGRRVLFFVLLVYVLFNALWGLNYNRKGIAYQLQLDVGSYSKEDLIVVMNQLVLKLNDLDTASRHNREALTNNRLLFEGAVAAYTQLASKNTLFAYSVPAVKSSMYSYLGNWLGFTGYYSPFSGEAQVNTAVPVYILPFVACHEIGHQLGYAKESEANFAAYLSATASADPRFKYATYFDMYAYAGRYLFISDSLALKQVNAKLSPAVKKDFADLRKFFRQYDNPVEIWIDRLYSQYLKANEQPSGQMSYNEVVAMLIAYYKKYGSI